MFFEVRSPEPEIEQGPDDGPLGGCIAGVGEEVGFLGDEGLPDARIGHRSPLESCASGSETRRECDFA